MNNNNDSNFDQDTRRSNAENVRLVTGIEFKSINKEIGSFSARKAITGKY